jgi:hypothetical protein
VFNTISISDDVNLEDTKEPLIEEGQTKQWPKEKRTKGSRKLNIGEPY